MAAEGHGRKGLNPRNLWILAFLWSVLVGVFMAFGPSYGGAGESLSADGTVTRSRFGRSGLDVNGPRILFILLIPVVLAALPIVVPSVRLRRILGPVAAGLFGVFCLVSMLSVGVLFLPALFAVVTAAGVDRVATQAPD